MLPIGCFDAAKYHRRGTCRFCRQLSSRNAPLRISLISAIELSSYRLRQFYDENSMMLQHEICHLAFRCGDRTSCSITCVKSRFATRCCIKNGFCGSDVTSETKLKRWSLLSIPDFVVDVQFQSIARYETY